MSYNQFKLVQDRVEDMSIYYYSGASSNLAPPGSKQNCRLKQSVGLSNSFYRENREMGARKTAGLSRDSAT